MGELLSLKWEDIDFELKQIHINISNNGQPRVIPMNNVVYTTLTRIPRGNGAVLGFEYGGDY